MNNISNQYPWTGYSGQQNGSMQTRSATYLQEKSLSTSELLDTDLVIETKDGDRVTINSEIFSQLDAYTYEGQSMVQTESGTSLLNQRYREISLSSGEIFSFSVEGDLNEDELKDIDSILKGIDKIISEMKKGDMEGALTNALNLGEFESFSAYNIDISYQQSYQMTSTTYAALGDSTILPNNEDHTGQSEKNSNLYGNTAEGTRNKNFLNHLLQQFDTDTSKTMQAARKPIHSLLHKHSDDIDGSRDSAKNLQQILNEAMEKILNQFQTAA